MSGYQLSFPFVAGKDHDNPERGPVALFDHESTHLDLRASLNLEQLDALIAALQVQREQLRDWGEGFLIL